jgi:hypothetical protein
MDIHDITKEVVRVGIYLLFDKGVLTYVGESENATARVPQHKGRKSYDEVWFIPYNGKRLVLESYLIEELRPKFNKAGNRPKAGFAKRAPPATKKEALLFIMQLNPNRIPVNPPKGFDLVKAAGLKMPSAFIPSPDPPNRKKWVPGLRRL